jgi:hypothetical protein
VRSRARLQPRDLQRRPFGHPSRARAGRGTAHDGIRP